MSDWDQRELCSDGGCVGVIGPDGLCKTCGRAAANWGDERNRGLTPLPPGDDELDDDDDDGDDDADDADDGGNDEHGDDAHDGAVPPDLAPALADPPTTGDWDARKLCPDDTCIGLIGPDGACKVCGSAAA